MLPVVFAAYFAGSPPQVVEWLRTHAIPLTTPEAGHGFADMKPLAKVVGNARIVSLGEATHGTREFFQLKHRMLEYLVSELGFTVFAIEANWPESLAVDEYITTGKGDPTAALSGMYFWTWDTEEVLAMIQWMRKWNADPAHRKKIHFSGFDMQTPSVAAKAVVDYFKKVDPAFAPEAEKLLAPYAGMFGPEVAAKVERSNLEKVRNRFSLEMRKTDPIARTLADHELRIVEQADELARAGMFGGPVRDRSMAENIGWLLDREPPGTRMVVWAHNGHVARDPMAQTSMGSQLAKKFGTSIVTFGFAFNEGSFQAMQMATGKKGGGLREFTAAPAREGSFDATLAATGLPLFAIDLRRVPSGPVGDWISAPHMTRSIGAVYSEAAADQFFVPMEVRKTFDAILFVAKTTRARPNAKWKGSPPLPAPARADNLDFEKLGIEPAGWLVPLVVRQGGYQVRVVEDHPHGGKRCLLLEGTPNQPNLFGNIMQRIDAAPYRGKKIRLRAAVRAQGRAQLWMRVDEISGMTGFFDNMQDRPITSGEWQEYTIEGDIESDAAVLNFGMMLIGAGKAWLDDVKLEVVTP